jgi:hypothetical protein
MSPGPLQALAPHALDLELMHHYSTTVYATLTCKTPLQYIWRDSVVRLALKCDYLMKTLLAVSAVHLAKLRPESQESYFSTAFQYHTAALQSAAPFLSHVKEVDDAWNLFIFSSLTIFFGTLSPSTWCRMLSRS